MTKQQKTILIIGLVAIILMLLFPPIVALQTDAPNMPMGYSFIVDVSHPYAINIVRLLLQWAAVGIVASVLMLIYKT